MFPQHEIILSCNKLCCIPFIWVNLSKKSACITKISDLCAHMWRVEWTCNHKYYYKTLKKQIYLWSHIIKQKPEKVQRFLKLWWSISHCSAGLGVLENIQINMDSHVCWTGDLIIVKLITHFYIVFMQAVWGSWQQRGQWKLLCWSDAWLPPRPLLGQLSSECQIKHHRSQGKTPLHIYCGCWEQKSHAWK